MQILNAEEPVHCPPEAASALIEPALRALARGPMLVIRVPLLRSTGESDLALVHEVRFRISHMRDESGLNDLVRITWEPESLIPMPDFTGTLTADWNADATGFVLELEGEYDPPGGIVGEVFDAFVGSRIAFATMHDLLCRTAGAVDELYQRAVTTGAPSSAEQAL